MNEPISIYDGPHYAPPREVPAPPPYQPPPPWTAEGALAEQVEAAEQRLQQREAELVARLEQLDEAKRVRLTVDTETTKARLHECKTAADLAADDAEIARTALEQVRQRHEQHRASGAVTKVDQLVTSQRPDSIGNREVSAQVVAEAARLGSGIGALTASVHEHGRKLDHVRAEARQLGEDMGIAVPLSPFGADELRSRIRTAFTRAALESGCPEWLLREITRP